MLTTMLIMFVTGYLLIALEHTIHINKTAIALTLSIILWTLYILANPSLIISGDPASFHNFITDNPHFSQLSQQGQVRKYITGSEIISQLGNISEILFYLLGAMTIVQVIDIYQGFSVITSRLTTHNKRKLLWLIAFITFFMSSVLDNMTSAIVMMLLVQKLLESQRERWIFGSIIIVAANAGGAWTPIGDVTTIMLWINDNISSGSIIKSIFLPSLFSMLIPLFLISFFLKGRLDSSPDSSAASSSLAIAPALRNRVLIVGVLCLLAVPVFKSLTELPPFAGIMLTLGIFWIYTDRLNNRQPSPSPQLRIEQILSKVDFATILFFLGILMSVAALEAIGILHDLAAWLNDHLRNIYLINILIGLLSSIIDNVPLVAATMAMYPLPQGPIPPGSPEAQYLMNFVRDGDFWNLIAYSTGTGGSILIIGSAAGVVVMGLEKINFMWYLKHISIFVILGFLGGIGIYYLI